MKIVARLLDNALWSILERVAGQHIPRVEEGLGDEECLGIPVDTMANSSFQELFVRTPVHMRGFGLRSLEQTTKAAFIGGVERAVSSFPGESGMCRHLEHLLGGGGEGAEWWTALATSGSRTGREFAESWAALSREGEQ